MARKSNSTFSEKIGAMVGHCANGYLKIEALALAKLLAIGTPSIMVRLAALAVRAALVVGALYASYWVVLMVLACFAFGKAVLAPRGGKGVAGFDSDALFPDPYAPENIHDAAFDHSDLN
jgi:hypothetical protein